jgi:hypothetical protein
MRKGKREYVCVHVCEEQYLLFKVNENAIEGIGIVELID